MIDLNRIHCPVDFSEFSEHALAVAMHMAKWYGASLHVLHVMPPVLPAEPSEMAQVARSLTQRNLTGIIARNRIATVAVTNEIRQSSDPPKAILECADEMNADLIVTGSHGRTGIRRTLLGSVVETLLHNANRPMLTVPSHIGRQRVHQVTFNNVLCAVDFSSASLACLPYAFSIAEECDAKLTLLHVIEQPPELERTTEPGEFDVAAVRAEAEGHCRKQLAALIPENARDYCTIETAVVEGGASRQILNMGNAVDADLIVLGVDSRSAFDLAFFGSSSKEVIRQAHCPVLVIPTPRLAALKAAS